MSKKRKAIKTDTAEISGSDSDVEFEPGLLDGNLSSGDEDLVSLVGDEEDYPSGSEDASEFESLNEEASASEDDNAGKIVGKNGVQSLKSRKEKPKGGLVRVNGAAQQSTLHIGSGLDLSEDMNGASRSDEEPGLEYTITEDANGNPRYVYGPIDPVYDSDDSDALATTNTIGNIPLSFYDSYPHIGYDINGKKVMRPAKGEALDALLDSVELPKGWTGLTDPATGKPLELTQEELEVLRRIHGNEIPEEGFDPYPATVEYFTSKTEIMPLSAAPEPKRRFVPSKHEAKRIMKIVRAIREGRILPYRPPPEEEEEDETAPKRYDIWANEAPRPDHIMNIPAPKLPIPGFDQSYNPPREYLPSKSEKKAWEEADQEDREKEYLPTRYDALRKVPGYDQFTKERFDRCLDLYLAPRVRRSRLNIDPESLLPKLPSPDELRPFPTTCSAIFRGHNSRVRSLAIDPSGIWLASGGDDGTVRLWELLTGRQVWNVTLSSEEAVNVVRWRPTTDAFILTAAVGNDIYFVTPPLVDPKLEAASIEILRAGFGYAASNTSSTAGTQKKDAPGKWTRATLSLVSSSVHVCISVRAPVKVLSWHRRGDYLVSCSPTGQSASIGMHTLSKHLSQLPFRRLKGLAQSVQFHPSKPILFVATQRAIRSYDLQKQELIKVLQPGARWISSFDMHPGGDNLIVGSYDRRLLWHDLDLSSKPYKTLRYHSKAIRAVRFHPGGHPLFADASDDGSVQVFHGKVVSDAMENATIVPLKVLRGHKVTKELGVLDIAFHPREPWLVSAGADGTCRLWM